MITRLLWLFSLLCLVTGCYTRPLPEKEPPATEDAIPELEYIVVSYSNVLYEEEECLFLLDSRAYYDEEGVQRICMKFRTQALVEVLEGRDLIVRVVEGFLARVNNDPILPLYISDFPLTADNLHINIEFESFFGKYVDPLYMARIVLDCGLVYYYANNAVDPDTMVWHQRIEPYEKAYRFSMFKHMDENLRRPLEHQLQLPYEEFLPMPHIPSAQLSSSDLCPSYPKIHRPSFTPHYPTPPAPNYSPLGPYNSPSDPYLSPSDGGGCRSDCCPIEPSFSPPLL